MKRFFKREKLNHESLGEKQAHDGLIVLGVIVFIVLANILGLVIRDKDFSERENRSMQTRPEIKMSTISNGQYSAQVEDYLQDQFPARGLMVSLKAGLDRISGIREMNGVYLGRKGYQMEEPKLPDEVWYEKNLNAINKFASNHEGINVYMTVVPNAAYVLSDYLPKGAPVSNQGEMLGDIKSKLNAEVKFVDVTDTLIEHKDEGLYYKSDHHWTSLGAKYAFDKISAEMGIENPVKDYTVYPVSKTFRGTMSSKSGVKGRKDLVEIYVPKSENNDYLVSYKDINEESLSMYKSEALDSKDKYTVFFGGNYGQVDIKTTSQNRRCLLVIKDSYANCFIQFLTPYFEHIIMIDPRYYYDSIDSIVAGEVVTDVLFLYNMNTYLEDKSLADCLEGE